LPFAKKRLEFLREPPAALRNPIRVHLHPVRFIQRRFADDAQARIHHVADHRAARINRPVFQDDFEFVQHFGKPRVHRRIIQLEHDRVPRDARRNAAPFHLAGRLERHPTFLDAGRVRRHFARHDLFELAQVLFAPPFPLLLTA